MTAYVLAQLRFKADPSPYKRYQAAFRDVFSKYRGRILASDDNPEPLEGVLGRDKVVLLEFPDAAEAHRFVESPEYQRIAADRRLGADSVFSLLKGSEPPAA